MQQKQLTGGGSMLYSSQKKEIKINKIQHMQHILKFEINCAPCIDTASTNNPKQVEFTSAKRHKTIYCYCPGKTRQQHFGSRHSSTLSKTQPAYWQPASVTKPLRPTGASLLSTSTACWRYAERFDPAQQILLSQLADQLIRSREVNHDGKVCRDEMCAKETWRISTANQ